MKRVMIGAGALLAIGAMALPSQATAARANATITFNYDSTDGTTYDYGGSIESSKPKCENSRKIVVYREQGVTDQKIGGTKSFPNFIDPGEPAIWSLNDRPKGGDGIFYATAAKTEKCKKAISNLHVIGS